MACHFTLLCGHTSTPTQQHFKWQSPKTAINMMRLAFEWHAVKADTNINRTHMASSVVQVTIFINCWEWFEEHQSVGNFQWASSKMNNVRNAKRTFSATNAFLLSVRLALCRTLTCNRAMTMFSIRPLAHCHQQKTFSSKMRIVVQSKMNRNDWNHAIEVPAACRKIFFGKSYLQEPL